MKIGEFVNLLNTTKDTVRHYEDLKFINPKWINNNKEYGEKEVLNFQVVKELKEYGLTLREIQIIFNLKEAYNCGDKELINQVFGQLTGHLNRLRNEEEDLCKRRKTLENEIEKIRDLI
ncbi:MerR family transcriptional regulator [Virgibacillus senegalensis]|uniref:MerR family transcriptional regulator n=1 Tax=Virgibacillus senegalensis TaxID=1499679 RepID=UPI00069D9499|nr:MerR family transcriptional regulator [Virgibacillus senegalensis]